MVPGGDWYTVDYNEKRGGRSLLGGIRITARRKGNDFNVNRHAIMQCVTLCTRWIVMGMLTVEGNEEGKRERQFKECS